MIPNPFADLVPNQPPPPAGGLVPLTGPSPDRQMDRQFKQRDQQLQEEANARAREDQQFQRQKFDWEKTKQTTDPKLVESERTAAFLATRVAGGIQDLENIFAADPNAAKPELGGALASVFGNEARNWANSPARRQVEAAQMDILDAALTLGTGAAYTKEQLEGYRQSYFPALTDDPATIRAKQQRLYRLLESAKVKAGSAAPQIDAALTALGGEQPARREGVVGPGDIGFAGTEAAPPGLDPEKQAAYDLFWKTNPEASAEQLKAFASSIGIDINNAEEIIAARNEGLGVRSGKDAVPRKVDISDVRRGDEIVDPFFRGVADTVTLGTSDELAAVVDTVGKGGTYADNLARERAIRDYDEENNFGPRFAGQIGGGFALPAFGASSASQLARVGAGYGAGYGFGSSDGGLPERLVSAAGGAAVGGASGAAFGLIGNHIASRGGGAGGGGSRSSAVELAAAAQRQNVDVLPADVGGAVTRRLTAGAAQLPFASGPIVRGAERVTDAVGERVGRIAAAEGAPVRQEVLGETARDAAQNYMESSGREGARLYDRARELSKGQIGFAGRGVAAIDRHLEELAPTQNTNAPEITALIRLRDDLAEGSDPKALPIDVLRSLRSSVRRMAQTDELRGSDFQRRAGDVLSSVAEDIAASLPEEASDAFRRADRQWAERLNIIDDVMENVLGPKDNRSAEAVAQRLLNMSRGDSARLRTFINNIPQDEAGIVRGSLIQEMGRASSSNQGATGSNFSLETFLTSWDKMPERTRSLLFRGESRAAIEDLARVAEGSRNAARYANRSNTGGAANVSQIGQAVSTGGLISTLGFSIPLELLTGHALASPRFTRILVGLAKGNMSPRRAAGKLGRIAAREPAIASDILPIQQALERGAARAAASEQEEDAR